jgi:ABC-type glycerol-3-phosphate transport system substrate-binding protein
LRAAGAAAVATIAGSACRSGARRGLRIWAHQGQQPEHEALGRVAAAFHAAEGSGVAVLEHFPDHHYVERLAIAAAAGNMPDVFELDGPLVARFAEARLLAPLDGLLSPPELADFLPSVIEQGTIDGRLYAIGAFESAVVLYYDRRAFEAAGVTAPVPALGFAWPELFDACARLLAAGIAPLDLHMGDTNAEWFTYGFSPVIWSGGGRLIDPSGGSVRGVLASPENVASIAAWQGLFERGYASSDPVDPDLFGNDEVAMDWSGHWMARSFVARKAERLGVMSLPRFGAQPISPCGSYCWALSPTASDPELGARWLRWVTGTDTGIRPLVAANGAVPARRSAFGAFPEYERLPFSLFRDQLERRARPRPRTPFYATLTRELAGALRDIAHGADVPTRLRRAEDEVQAVIDRRRGWASRREG